MKEQNGFTRLELALVVAALFGFSAITFAAAASTQHRSRVAQCFNNLRQVGRASQAWASQHGDRFPWQLRPPDGVNNAGGGAPIAVNPFIHFALMSNELASPRVLVCPSDTAKKTASDFSARAMGGFLHFTYQNVAVSYFVGLDTTFERPRGLLFGDRNIRTSRQKLCGLVFVMANSLDGNDPNLGFTNGLHSFSGQVCLMDGSVQSGDSSLLRKLALHSGDGVDGGAVGGPAPTNDSLVPGQPYAIPE